MQTQTTQPLPQYSQYTVRLMAPCVWRTVASALRSTFGNHRIYQLQPAETESVPNVICDTTAFGRNRMSAESAYLSTFGAETETEAEIRSTSS